MPEEIRLDTFDLLGSGTSVGSLPSLSETPKSRSITRQNYFWYRRRYIPYTNSSYLKLSSEATRSKPLLNWRTGAFASSSFVAGILLINICFTTYLIRTYPISNEGIGTITKGSCDHVARASTIVHIAINICSTVVVAASNYNMQCLTAPSREEVDRVHGRKGYLDIGINSVRNLFKLPIWKSLLWLVLLLSTLPLHLLWNSAVFTVTTYVQYAGIIVTSNYAEANTYGLDCSEIAMEHYRGKSTNASVVVDEEAYTTCWLLNQARTGTLQTLSDVECRSRYAQKLQSDKFNLIAVTKNASAIPSKSFPAKGSLPVLAYWNSLSFPADLSSWCLNQCPLNTANQNTTSEVPYGWCKPWHNDNSFGVTGYNESLYGNPCGKDYTRSDWWVDIETNKSSWCGDPDWDSSHTSYACYQFAANTSESFDTISSLRGTSEWLCGTDRVLRRTCKGPTSSELKLTWQILPEQYDIDHCLASSLDFGCELQYSQMLLCVVIACNIVKLICMVTIIVFCREPVLMTTGDGIASFLTEPDETTKGHCLHTYHVHRNRAGVGFHPEASRLRGSVDWSPRVWTESSRHAERWIHSIAPTKVYICCLTWMFAIALVVGQLTVYGKQAIAEEGFGKINIDDLLAVSTYIGGSNLSLISTSLLVNAPQVVFSTMYFMFNTAFTAMASAHEWSLFAKSKRTLRVTSPAGAQRSTYWLSLPWKYSLPMLAASAFLHWCISQSIFLVNIRVRTPTNQLLTGPSNYFPSASNSGITTAAGFSPLASILTLSAGVLMLVYGIAVCFLRLSPGSILVGSNSFAISAACHPLEDDRKSMALEPIMWGAIRHQIGDIPGHCCFSTMHVDRPVKGEIYA